MSEGALTLQEALQLYELLQKIDQQMAKLDTQKPSMKEMVVTLSQIQLLTGQIYTLLRRWGVPEELAQAIQAFRAMFILVKQLELALRLLEMQLGPVGWVIAGLGIVTTTLSTVDMIGSYG